MIIMTVNIPIIDISGANSNNTTSIKIVNIVCSISVMLQNLDVIEQKPYDIYGIDDNINIVLLILRY